MFVGDAKYKRREAGAPAGDIYQALAYVVATGLSGGLLVYAAGEASDRVLTIPALGRQIWIRTLDLAGEPEKVLAGVNSIAETARALRALSEPGAPT